MDMWDRTRIRRPVGRCKFHMTGRSVRRLPLGPGNASRAKPRPRSEMQDILDIALETSLLEPAFCRVLVGPFDPIQGRLSPSSNLRNPVGWLKLCVIKRFQTILCSFLTFLYRFNRQRSQWAGRTTPENA